MHLPHTFGVCVLAAALLLAATGFAQEAPVAETPTPASEAAPNPPVDTAPAAPPEESAGAQSGIKQMSLWEMFRAGGPVLVAILILSVLACVMVVYFILTVTPNREVPALFIKRAHAQIRAGDLRGAYQMCEGRDELIAQVLRAGLKMHGHDRYVIQEAMESEGERGATALWQKISYLNNIGVIAPLLGLLGTVWGMIGAFGAIAMNDSENRSLVMAYNVAQAMITTAAGLMLAIPAMLVYYYLRGRVVKIVAEVEAQATEFVELLSGGPSR